MNGEEKMYHPPTPALPPLVELPWYEMFCPLLTASELTGRAMRPKPAKPIVVSALLQANGPKAVEPEPEDEPEFVGCQGPRCAFFVIVNGPDGKPVGGRCAQALGPSAAWQQAAATRELVHVMSGGTVAQPDGSVVKT